MNRSGRPDVHFNAGATAGLLVAQSFLALPPDDHEAWAGGQRSAQAPLPLATQQAPPLMMASFHTDVQLGWLVSTALA